jgi:uncharacterized protein
MNDDADLEALRHFDGVARLFPLPNFVLFPHVRKGLHIFEPRYRQMTEDALASDRLIAMVLLRPGWEKDYDGAPEIHSMACMAHIINHERLPDGKFNLEIRGLCRLEIEEEVLNLKPYRSARGKIACDPLHDDNPIVRQELANAASPWLQGENVVLMQFQALFQSKLPAGVLCDILASFLPLAAEVKQELLAESRIDKRVEHLLRVLRMNPPELLPMPRPMHHRKFPPDFSTN